MFDYTKAAIDTIVRDLKRIFFAFNIFVQLLYIGYLVYVLATGRGVLAANIILIALSASYLVLFVVTYNKKERQFKKLAKRTYSLIKIAVNAFTIGIAIYGIYSTAGEITPTSIVMLVLMVLGWLVSVLLQVLIYFIESRKNLVIEALKADKEQTLKPITSVTNAVKKFVGKETAPESEPNRHRRFLDRKVEAKKQEKEYANK